MFFLLKSAGKTVGLYMLKESREYLYNQERRENEEGNKGSGGLKKRRKLCVREPEREKSGGRWSFIIGLLGGDWLKTLAPLRRKKVV